MEYKKGHVPWNKGKHYTKEIYEKMFSRETNKKRSNTLKDKPKSEKHKRKLSLALKKTFKNGRKPTIYWKGKKFSKKHKEKISNKLKGIKKDWLSIEMKRKWKNKEWREKTIQNTLKAIMKRPTSLEKQFINLIKKHNLPYKYTGNGSFLIGYKNPDFININGEKICIEVGNKFHHQGNYKNERIKHFAKWG